MLAGMVEHMAMFPVDTLKTRMQMISAVPFGASSPPLHFGRFITSIVQSEGPIGLYRGIGAMGLGAVPAHAVYFSVYELYKQSFGGNGPGHHAAAGVVATTASDTGLTPMDVVKQRLLLRWRPYGGVKDCAVRMFREEGIRAFYASCKTTVVMNAPFTAVHFSTYEAMKKVLGEVSQENASDEMVMVHLTVASAVTTPLDVMKTRLQCQNSHYRKLVEL